jgi:hypothetical protein
LGLGHDIKAIFCNTEIAGHITGRMQKNNRYGLLSFHKESIPVTEQNNNWKKYGENT